MPKSKILIVIIAISVIFGLSCEQASQEMDMNVVSKLQSIPANYGSLVSVTTLPSYPDWVQMWFQDEEGVIRVVRVQFVANLAHNDVKVITRN